MAEAQECWTEAHNTPPQTNIGQQHPRKPGYKLTDIIMHIESDGPSWWETRWLYESNEDAWEPKEIISNNIEPAFQRVLEKASADERMEIEIAMLINACTQGSLGYAAQFDKQRVLEAIDKKTAELSALRKKLTTKVKPSFDVEQYGQRPVGRM